MGAAENRRLIETYYEALSAGDFEMLASLHAEDVVFNLVGNTPEKWSKTFDIIHNVQ